MRASRTRLSFFSVLAVVATVTAIRGAGPETAGPAEASQFTPPQVRNLTSAERSLAQQVFSNRINYDLVRVTNTLGLGDRPWTSNTPPLWTINVGSAYSSLTSNAGRRQLLIHELAHVWQGQHAVPFMLNSTAHQGLSMILNGGSVAPAYNYTLPGKWSGYNVEQQANIVTDWYAGGMQTSDPRFPFIRDHIRAGKPF
jgi:hypothetical protein